MGYSGTILIPRSPHVTPNLSTLPVLCEMYTILHSPLNSALQAQVFPNYHSAKSCIYVALIIERRSMTIQNKWQTTEYLNHWCCTKQNKLQQVKAQGPKNERKMCQKWYSTWRLLLAFKPSFWGFSIGYTKLRNPEAPKECKCEVVSTVCKSLKGMTEQIMFLWAGFGPGTISPSSVWNLIYELIWKI